MKPHISIDPAALRRLAASRLKARPATKTPQTMTDLPRLQHELEIQQIELELQDEELLAAQSASANALERYTDLYDFAPVGYFNLTAHGAIRQVNLTGARLVGITRGRLVGQSFRLLVAEASRRVFGDFLARVFSCETKQTCELTLAKAVGSTSIVQLEATHSPDHAECRAVMLDITERKQAEEKLRELGNQLNRAQEYERRRIARELHDSTGQKLAAMSMTFGLLQDVTTAPTSRTRKMFADGMALIEQCAQEIRTLSYLLHPPLLDGLGLAAAIADYVEGFTKRSNVRVSFNPPPDFGRLPDAVEMALFRVVQESLGNIFRHARALAARIHLFADAQQVTLEVCDPGSGISAKTLLAIQAERGSSGMGIAGMRERLRLVGGRLEIKSGKRGTTIRAIVPRLLERERGNG